ncbi:UrcA family protein [uncultured Maricaulis sp.]|uniref:UrcA family protein n=1 Tax=uncultured Maricaulis sp. TaxID=174710 RepID=UPI0030D9A987
MSAFHTRPILSALAASMLLSGPVSAQARSVSFDRSELNSEAGAARVLEKIDSAARAACRTENRNSAMEALSNRICVRDTVARAVAEIRSPCLTDLGSGLLTQRILLLCAVSVVPRANEEVQ